MNAPLPVYADEETLATIDKRFGYVFEALSEDATMYYKPVLIPHTVTHGDEFTVGRIPVRVFTQDHGYCDSLGFRFGPVAYSSDAVELPDDAFEMLRGVKLWIIGTLTDTPHPTHAHVDKAVDWMKRVGAEHGVLTHMSGLLDYDTLAAHLPDWVEPAYDGLVIDTES